MELLISLIGGQEGEQAIGKQQGCTGQGAWGAWGALGVTGAAVGDGWPPRCSQESYLSADQPARPRSS